MAKTYKERMEAKVMEGRLSKFHEIERDIVAGASRRIFARDLSTPTGAAEATVILAGATCALLDIGALVAECE